MLRRDFSYALAATSAAALCMLPTAQAQTPRPFQDGVDYLTLDKRAPADAGAGKIEVVEFFWYSCPHCNAFEPKLEAWVKNLPKDVVVRRVPVGFREEFIPQQRLFYTLEAMGKLPELHAKVFYAIHVEKQVLNTQASIGAWIEKQGVDKTKFDALYNSFSVSTKTRKATQLQDEFKVDGVPALGIAGRFYTSGSVAQTMERALTVTDFLLEQVRKGR
ncbi:MAG: thiol:disulfide interchange protein DsbA/DsbL [Burkholderiaceae bacterium]